MRSPRRWYLDLAPAGKVVAFVIVVGAAGSAVVQGPELMPMWLAVVVAAAAVGGAIWMLR